MTASATANTAKSLELRLYDALVAYAKALAAKAGFDAQADLYRDLGSKTDRPALSSFYANAALDSRLKAIHQEREAVALEGRVQLLEQMVAEATPAEPAAVSLPPEAVAAVDETAGV